MVISISAALEPAACAKDRERVLGCSPLAVEDLLDLIEQEGGLCPARTSTTVFRPTTAAVRDDPCVMQDDRIAREMIAAEPTELTEAQSLYYSDLRRQRGRRGLLMELLSDENWHQNVECAKIGGVSYQCSLYTFRQDGWVIESRKDKGGVWSYRLAGKDEQVRERRLNAPQREVAKTYVAAVVRTMGQAASETMLAALPMWLRVG